MLVTLALLGAPFAPLVASVPISNSQTMLGGPPAGIYGTNFTKSGPVSQGNTTFPKQADKDVTNDDILFQNLLSAEWIVRDFYKQGVEYFTQNDFTKAGHANDTMKRLTQIYQNENGHLRLFEAAIPAGVVSYAASLHLCIRN
jgi:hypothetical protein